MVSVFKITLSLVHSTPEAGWITTILLSGYDVAKNNNIIGKPVAGVEIKIIDINGESVPFDTMGEVCVRSAQVWTKLFYNLFQINFQFITFSAQKDFTIMLLKANESLHQTDS